MSDFEEQMRDLSQKEQAVARVLVEVHKSLYAEVEGQLLEGFLHMATRPRDGFDALVLVSSLAREIQSLAVGTGDLHARSEKEFEKLLLTVTTIGGAIGHKLIAVSPDFPFSADEMVAATSPHINAGPEAFSDAVSEAINRLGPVMIDLARYMASVHPVEYAAFARMMARDMGVND